MWVLLALQTPILKARFRVLSRPTSLFYRKQILLTAFALRPLIKDHQPLGGG